MQVDATQHQSHLKPQNLAPLYLISGDEPLLTAEAETEIIQRAKAAGFDEVTRFQIDPQFDINLLAHAAESLSLFSSQRVLCCHFTHWPSANTANWLMEYIEHPATDIILILCVPKLSPREKNSRLGKSLLKKAIHTALWPIAAYKMPGWLQSRAKTRGLKLAPDALSLLATRTEGNLLAATQTLEKLTLHFGKQTINAAQLDDFIQDTAQFNTFDLITATLLGQTERALRILNVLKAERGEPVLILAALVKDLRLTYQLQQSNNPAAFFQQQRIWQNKQRELSTAAHSLNARALRALLSEADEIDSVIKGALPGNSWDRLYRLMSRIALRAPAFPCVDSQKSVQCATNLR